MGYTKSNTLPVPLRRHRVALPVGPDPPTAPPDFADSLASAGGILSFADAPVAQVQWRVSAHSLVVLPLLWNDNRFGVDYTELEVRLLSPVVPHCVAASAAPDAVVLEFLDAEYVFVALRLPLAALAGDTALVALDRFPEWGHVLVPYLFELLLAPHRLVRAGDHDVLVLLKLGELLQMLRPAVLADCDVYTMEAAPQRRGLWGWRTRPEPHVGGVAALAVVDAVRVGPLIATLLVLRRVQWWDPHTHREAHPPTALGGDAPWLTLAPARYMCALGARRVLVGCPLASDGIDFVLLDAATGLEVPGFRYTPADDDPMWFVHDFWAAPAGDGVELALLWKSNTLSRLQVVALGPGGAPTAEAALVAVAPAPEVEGADPDAPQHRVLDGGVYLAAVVDAAVAAVCHHHGLEVPALTLIRKRAVLTATRAPGPLAELWRRVDELCRQYANMTHEVVALAPGPPPAAGPALWTALHADGSVGVFAPAHPWELPEPAVAPVVAAVAQAVLVQTAAKVVHQLMRGPVDAAAVAAVYAQHLAERVGDADAERVAAAMAAVPDAEEVLRRVVEVPAPPPSLHTPPPTGDMAPLAKQAALAALMLVLRGHRRTLEPLVVALVVCEPLDAVVAWVAHMVQWLQRHRVVETVVDTCFSSGRPRAHVERKRLGAPEHLMWWLAVVDRHPQLNHWVRGFEWARAFDYVATQVLGGLEYVVDVVVDLLNRGEGAYVQRHFGGLLAGLPVAPVLAAVVQLVCLHPRQFAGAAAPMVRVPAGDAAAVVPRLTVLAALAPEIARMVRALVAGHDSEYYAAVARMAQAVLGLGEGPDAEEVRREFLEVALEFQQRAIDERGGEGEEGDGAEKRGEEKRGEEAENREENRGEEEANETHKTTEKALETAKTETPKTQTETADHDMDAVDATATSTDFDTTPLSLATLHAGLFDLALQLDHYPAVYRALLALDGSPGFPAQLERLVRHVVARGDLQRLLAPNRNAVYRAHYLDIDAILLEIAASETGHAASLRAHQYLYSWRLFGACTEENTTKGGIEDQLADRRGAVEALYGFISRFRRDNSRVLELHPGGDLENYRLTIVELYLIILNCLKGFAAESDRWLRKREPEGFSVVNVDDLSLEYYEWVSQLAV